VELVDWGQTVSRQSREWAGDTPTLLAFGAIAVAAIGLAYLALTGVHIGGSQAPSTVTSSSSSSSSSLATSSTPTATPAPSGSVVDLVGGSEGWWSTSVGAGAVPGVTAGVRVGGSEANTASLASQLATTEVSSGRLVLVQAGAQDIVDGATGEQIDAGIRGLWSSVTERGGRPVAVLLQPSNTFPGSVIAVNGLIRASALEQGVAVLDLTTPVANADGTWAAGLSDDGLQPNAAGTALLVQAVSSQLPGLVGTDSAQG
jgi:lysophospholipase L1-like esterase